MLIYGDRVRSARLLRGISANTVAEQLGWSSPTQSRVESTPSQDIPKDQVEKLGGFLHVPVEFLTTAPPPALAHTELLFRAPARTTKREKSYLAEYARTIGEVLSWLDERHRLPPVRIPNLSPSANLVEAAAQTRERLNLQPLEPIPHLTHQVERAGIIIIVRDGGQGVGALHSLDEDAGEALARSALREDHHAYTTRVGDLRDRPIIVARAHNSWEQTRLTVAHEVGHLVLHNRELPPDAEEQAFEFGAELLAPAAALRPILPQPVTLAALVPIKLHFGISLGALIRHLLRSELVAQQRFTTLESQLYRRQHPETGTTWGRQEPGWDAQTPERPMLLRAWLERCAGTSESGAVVAGALRQLPADLVASMLSGQRRPGEPSAVSEPVSRPSRSRGTVVVDLATRRGH